MTETLIQIGISVIAIAIAFRAGIRYERRRIEIKMHNLIPQAYAERRSIVGNRINDNKHYLDGVAHAVSTLKEAVK